MYIWIFRNIKAEVGVREQTNLTAPPTPYSVCIEILAAGGWGTSAFQSEHQLCLYM
jgi:hypothetical protein